MNTLHFTLKDTWLKAENDRREAVKDGRKTNESQTLDALGKICRDLVQEVKDHKIDPVIGRDEEIRRVIEILSRKTKNNPVLIGEPGVGKTAICEGLAQRIYHDEVPEGLSNKISTKTHELGWRVLIMQNTEKIKGKHILFIDELQFVNRRIHGCGEFVEAIAC